MPSDTHPFLSHLVAVLAVYEQGPTLTPTPLPRYDGPRDWQTDAVERGIASIAWRMHTAEGVARTHANDTIDDVYSPTTSTTPMSTPNFLDPNPSLDPETTVLEELRLLKAHVGDVARVCQAVTRGDLSQKITVPVQGAVMVQLKDVINTMVDMLGQFATEVMRVAREVGTEGILGGQADAGGVQGTWKEITLSVNKMVHNLTTQLRGIALISAAAVDGDFTRFLTVETCGEMDALKTQINQMVFNLREATKRNTAAELANRSQSKFLADMSDDFRTPMNAIIETTELILHSDLKPSQRESLLLVHGLARSLSLTMDDILDISTIEAGQMTLEQVSYSLRSTVFGILKTLVVRAEQNNLDLMYDVDPAIPDQLVGDASRLGQVITNLVRNALKSTPSKASGQGTVALRCRLLALAEESVTLEFCVSDTGIGIAHDKLNIVFDDQAGGSTTREYGGTGLELAISKRLVSLMHGTMSVESELGKGSKFFFRITAQASSESPSLETVLQRMAPFAGRTILYIATSHDGESVAKLIESMGLKTHVVHDMTAVSDPARCPHVDVILLDSPNISGVEHLRSIPTVLLSSAMRGLNMKWCLDNSVIAQVPTPASPQALSAALLSALESNTENPDAAPQDMHFEVLLAENSIVNQRLVVQILNKDGHRVEIVENGALAVDAFKQRRAEGRPFDIILMDVSMPFMGGLEATELIRASELRDGLPRTPIVALTAHPMTGDRERCLQAGMDDRITKPLRRSDLLDVISKLVHERTGNRA